MENQVADQTDLKTLAQAYLDAFHAQDLEKCLSFFSDDATVDFNKTLYTGKEGLTEWHKDRFAANLKMIKMNSMTVDGDTVVVDGAVSSKRLAAWRLKALSGRVTMKFENGKIKFGKLSPRMTNQFNMMREDMGA